MVAASARRVPPFVKRGKRGSLAWPGLRLPCDAVSQGPLSRVVLLFHARGVLGAVGAARNANRARADTCCQLPFLPSRFLTRFNVGNKRTAKRIGCRFVSSFLFDSCRPSWQCVRSLLSRKAALLFSFSSISCFFFFG